MPLFYSKTTFDLHNLDWSVIEKWRAEGDPRAEDYALLPPTPEYDALTHNPPHFVDGAWVPQPKTAEELAAFQEAQQLDAEREQLKTIYNDLRNGTGTTAQRFQRVEKVCAYMIKRLLAVFVAVCFALLPAAAQTPVKTYPRVARVKMTWDEPTDRLDIKGYRIYHKMLPTDTVWTQVADFAITPENKYTFTAFPGPGLYMMTAYGVGVESEPSNTVVLPGPPKALKIQLLIEIE